MGLGRSRLQSVVTLTSGEKTRCYSAPGLTPIRSGKSKHRVLRRFAPQDDKQKQKHKVLRRCAPQDDRARTNTGSFVAALLRMTGKSKHRVLRRFAPQDDGEKQTQGASSLCSSG
jgi:hypothetical protein